MKRQSVFASFLRTDEKRAQVLLPSKQEEAILRKLFMGHGIGEQVRMLNMFPLRRTWKARIRAIASYLKSLGRLLDARSYICFKRRESNNDETRSRSSRSS